VSFFIELQKNQNIQGKKNNCFFKIILQKLFFVLIGIEIFFDDCYNLVIK